MKLFFSNRAIKEFKIINSITKYDIDVSDKYSWRIDYLQEFHLFMVTNEISMYTILFGSFITISEIEDALFPKDHKRIEYLSRQNRRVIGIMVEMRKIIEYCFDTIEGANIKSIEDNINDIIYGPYPYFKPIEEHNKLITNAELPV